MIRIIGRVSRVTMSGCSRYWLISCSCLLVSLTSHVLSSPGQTAHCWNNAQCKGSISQSFLNENDCCRHGAMAYIKCTDTQCTTKILKMIPMNNNATNALCVPCPNRPATTTRKPSASCLQAICAADERCVTLASSRKAVCVKFNCAETNCNQKSGVVCGTDKNTYNNECAMLCGSGRNAQLAYKGSCQANPTCASITCDKGFVCLQKPGEGARCERTKVVCGDDKVSYASMKDLRLQACKKGGVINVHHHGPCKTTDTPVVVSRERWCFFPLIQLSFT